MEEIFDLVETLNRTEKRLEELTAGQVDSVVDRQGQTFFLRRAQEEMRFSESIKQAGILNALPSQIALVDTQGIIVSVNESWRQFATSNVLQGPGFGVGQNYLEICERSMGDCCEEAQAAAKGIRRVLQGEEKEFTLEYPCHSPTEKRWYRLVVTPVNSDHLAGAIVMHVDITELKKSEEALRSSETRMAIGQRIAHLGSWELSLIHADDLGTCPLQWSDEMFRIAGYEPGAVKVTRELFYRLVPVEEHAKLQQAVMAAISSHEPYSIFHRLIRPNGEERMIHEEAHVLFDEKTGQPSKIVGTSRDVTEEKQAHEQLVSRTALLEAQLNSTLDGILVVDGEGKLVLQNHKIIELWNPPQEIFDELDHPKRLEWHAAQVVNPQQFSERVAYIYAHPNEIVRDELELTNGKIFDRYVAPIIDRDGKYFGRIWIYRDVTERRQATRQMEELSVRTERRERLLSTALGSMRDFAQIYDRAGRILFVNQPLLDLWGITLEEAVGKSFLDLGYPKELAEKLDRQLQEVFRTGQEITDETPYKSPTGVEGHYEYILSPALAKDGTVDFVIGSTRDVTLRKRAEVEVRFNEKRYRSLVEATAAIVWDTPASGEFTEEQPGWTAFTGQTFEELRGWGWLNAIHPEDRAETERVWSAAVANRSRYEVEHRMQTSNKTYRNMLVRAVPILGEDGTIRQWIGIHTDITERKQLENQFLRAQRMESIGTLAGGIAHDLNNALAPIMMSIDMLRMKFADQESQELLATLSSSAQRGADMVRQVLSFARGVEGRHMEVQARHVIRDVEKIAKDTFLKNIQVRTIIGTDLWTVMGDPTQVHQVLLNLCVNARDAMPEGGTLTLSAENVQVDEHYAGMVSEAHSGPYVLLQVEDTGSGMPAGVIEKIFDPFFTTKEIGKGTGLGLSTSLAIVKSHGGFIRVYSEMGKGTKFKVYLPAQTEASSETAGEIAAEMPRGNGEIILVVDDEASVRHITQQTLQAFGYRVILSSDGVEALSIYARQGQEIAVVLTDMMMPMMDGAALIRVLRKLNPNLPIIGASGLSVAKQTSQSGGLGITRFLPKPYMANELLKNLREILSSKKESSSAPRPTEQKEDK